MLTAKKNIVKKNVSIEPAPFSWANIQAQAVKNGKLIGIIAGVIVVVIVALYFYRAGLEEDNQTASVMLSKVQALYQEGNYQAAIDGDPARGITGLEAIVSQYGSTPNGQQAILFLGNCYLYTDNYDKAIATFSDASPDSDLLKAATQAGLATAYYNKGEYASAAEYFEKSAKSYKNDVLSAERNMNGAEAYLKAGNKDAARELLIKAKGAKTTKFDGEIIRITAQYDIEID